MQRKVAFTVLSCRQTCKHLLGGTRRQLTTEATCHTEIKPFSDMPGEKGLPFVGTTFKLAKDFRREPGYDRGHFVRDFHRKYGDIFRLKVPGGWFVSVCSPSEAESMFRAEGEYPSRGYHEDNFMWIYKQMNLPPPMFFSKGEVWKKTRSNAARQIVPRRVGNFVGPLCEVVDDFLNHLETLMDEQGRVADIVPEINKWAFQGVSYFVYGEKINTYSQTNPEQQEFIEAGLALVRSIVKTLNAVPVYKIFPTKAYRTFVQIVRRLHRAGQQILEDRCEKLKDEIASGVVDESKALGLIEQWMIEGKFTEEEALSSSYDMLAAGIDTVGLFADYNSMARDERYIADPEDFIPERWNKDSEEKMHPFASLPFGFGPRSCYGRRLAELELFVLLAKMLPKYKISTSSEKLKSTRCDAVLRPAEPLEIKFIPRKE